MKTEDLGNSKILNLIFKPAGAMMGSKFRQWLADPVKTLRGADIKPGQTVLEVGCGCFRQWYIFRYQSQSFGPDYSLILTNEMACTITDDVKADAINIPLSIKKKRTNRQKR